jgi:uncharacterized membrane protein
MPQKAIVGLRRAAATQPEQRIALGDYVIASSIAFIVFTFSSLIVAIQIASGQLTPRIIATALLRDKTLSPRSAISQTMLTGRKRRAA